MEWFGARKPGKGLRKAHPKKLEGRAPLTEQIRPQDRAAAVAISFEWDLLLPHQPLKAITVHEGAHDARGVLWLHRPELPLPDSHHDNRFVPLPAAIEEGREKPAKPVIVDSHSQKVEKDAVDFTVDLGAVEKDFKLRGEAGPRRVLGPHDFVQSGGELREKPLEDSEQEILLRGEIVKRPALARAGTRHYRID